MTLVSGFEKIVREQEPLGERTWLKLGGMASFYAEPNSVDELAALVRRCCDEEVSIRVLGEWLECADSRRRRRRDGDQPDEHRFPPISRLAMAD